jgi:hypothetical protein
VLFVPWRVVEIVAVRAGAPEMSLLLLGRRRFVD